MSTDGTFHDLLAPSSADRWVPCPGSVSMAARYPENGDTEQAREGTAAHWAACEEAAGRGAAVGQVTPEGWVLDEDQIQGAELFAKHLPPHIMQVALLEQRLEMPQIHPRNSGTTDLGAIDWNARTAYISDYKYGRSPVEVTTWQLIDYAAGLANRVPAIGPDWLFELTIVQPRVFHRDGHVRRWRVSYNTLALKWQSMAFAAEEATSPDPRLQTGPHCKHCPARHACPALHNDVLEIANRLEVAAPLELPDNALGFELRQLYQMKQLLDSRVSGLEAEAESRIKAGRSVPWLALESVPAREGWKVSPRAVIEVGKLYGLDLAKPAQPATPRQARMLGLPESVTNALAARGASAVKLSVVNSSDIRRIFVDNAVK